MITGRPSGVNTDVMRAYIIMRQPEAMQVLHSSLDSFENLPSLLLREWPRSIVRKAALVTFEADLRNAALSDDAAKILGNIRMRVAA